MFKGAFPDTFLIMVDLDEDAIEDEAESSQYSVKVHGLSAKVPFNRSLKKKVQPFKSKDKQFLIIQKMEKMFDLHKLRSKGVLMGVVPMHDDQSLFYIHEKYAKPARFIPHSFATFKAFFMEDYEDTRMSDIMSYMHYFGEKQAISNIFFEFSTIYMMIPAIIAIMLTIYQ